jgi:protein O-mannosyl-transferase
MAGLFTAWVERNLIGAEGSDFNFSIIERLLIAGRVVWFYLGKLFWPANLIFVYPRWQVSQTVWWQIRFPDSNVAGAWNIVLAEQAVARPVGGTALFHRDPVPGTRLPECVSVPLFICRGPFPIPG